MEKYDYTPCKGYENPRRIALKRISVVCRLYIKAPRGLISTRPTCCMCFGVLENESKVHKFHQSESVKHTQQLNIPVQFSFDFAILCVLEFP